MDEVKCSKCDGNLKGSGKETTVILPDKSYEMKKAELHECEECGHKSYVV